MARNLFIKILCMYNKTKKTTLLNSNNETATHGLRVTLYTVVHKKCETMFLPIFLPSINRFSKFFQRHTLRTICNNAII